MIYRDARNSSNYPESKQSDKIGKEAYYCFTLPQPMEVAIDHNLSSLSDTYISFLDRDGKLLHNSGNNDGQAKLDLKQLPGGTYYVVSEGISLNSGIPCAWEEDL